MFIEFTSDGQIKSLGVCANNIYVALCDEMCRPVEIGDLPYLVSSGGKIYRRANVYVSRWSNGVIDNVGGVPIYHLANADHTVDRIGDTYIYRLTNGLIDRVGDTYVYRLANADRTVDRVGDTYIYRLTNGLIDRVGDAYIYRLGNGRISSVGGMSAESLANCFLRV